MRADAIKICFFLAGNLIRTFNCLPRQPSPTGFATVPLNHIRNCIISAIYHRSHFFKIKCLNRV